MSWVTAIWSVNVGICLTLAAVHLMAWVKLRHAWVNLAFAICAASVASVAVCELLAMRAQTPAEYGHILRWAHIPVAVMVCSLVWFIRAYLQAGHAWLIWAIFADRALALLANFTTGVGVNFKEIDALRHVQLLGEMAALPVGTASRWDVLIRVSEILILIFIVDSATGAWRQGQRRRAAVIGISLLGTIFAAATVSTLFTHGNLAAPVTVSVPFMLLMVVMGYELGTELVRARETAQELELSEARFRATFEQAAVGIAHVSPEGRFLRINRKFCDIVGYSAAEMCERRFQEITHPDDLAADVAQAERLLRGEIATYAIEKRYIRKDGSAVWVHLTGSLVRKETGGADWFVAVVKDITERRQSENERDQLRAELIHLNRVMTLSELSSSLAHEINQPLGAILNNASAARIFVSKLREGKEEMEEILADIVQDASRAGQIVRNIRALSKKEQAEAGSLDLNRTIREGAELLRERIIGQQATLRLDLQPDLPPVLGNRIGLQQVVINLLVNALEAMQDSSAKNVTIRSALESRDTVTVSVCDTGRGCNGVESEKVFDAFYTTKKDGLGMGLRICRTLVEEYGGRIWLEEGPGPGATFCFSLNTCREVHR